MEQNSLSKSATIDESFIYPINTSFRLHSLLDFPAERYSIKGGRAGLNTSKRMNSVHRVHTLKGGIFLKLLRKLHFINPHTNRMNHNGMLTHYQCLPSSGLTHASSFGIQELQDFLNTSKILRFSKPKEIA